MAFVTTQDGVNIYFKDWGPKEAQPIVFHHGWPLSADDWDNQMLFFLAEGFRVIAIDRRGHGRSDQVSEGHDMDHYAADVSAVVEHLDLHNAVHVGHSTGGGQVARYVARYGEEQLFPVLRTEFGNIAVSTVQNDPMVFAAYAMRGVEIMFRTATLFNKIDVQAIAGFNNFYSAMSNITFPAGSPYAWGGGGSLIVDPRGKVLAEDPSNDEAIIEAEIDMAALRQGRGRPRHIPHYPMGVVDPVFKQYVEEFPLNHLDVPVEQLPDSGQEMKVLMDKQSRWKAR